MTKRLSLSQTEAIRAACLRFAPSDDNISIGVGRILGDDGSVEIVISRPGKSITKRAG